MRWIRGGIFIIAVELRMMMRLNEDVDVASAAAGRCVEFLVSQFPESVVQIKLVFDQNLARFLFFSSFEGRKLLSERNSRYLKS